MKMEKYKLLYKLHVDNSYTVKKIFTENVHSKQFGRCQTYN